MSTVGTSNPLGFGDEKRLIYLAITNACWLPYLTDQGVRYMAYSTHRVRRQFGLN